MDIKKINSYVENIRNEIKQGKFDNAISRLEEFINELPNDNLDIQLLSLTARYNLLKQKSGLGVLQDDNEINKLIYNLIELLNDAKQVAEDMPKMVLSTKAWADIESDDRVYGDPDHFIVLFKVISSSLKKSTKAMQLDNGCIIQVTTERKSPEGTWSVAEAISFIPNAKIVKDDPKNYEGKDREVGYHLEYSPNS